MTTWTENVVLFIKNNVLVVVAFAIACTICWSATGLESISDMLNISDHMPIFDHVKSSSILQSSKDKLRNI